MYRNGESPPKKMSECLPFTVRHNWPNYYHISLQTTNSTKMRISQEATNETTFAFKFENKRRHFTINSQNIDKQGILTVILNKTNNDPRCLTKGVEQTEKNLQIVTVKS